MKDIADPFFRGRLMERLRVFQAEQDFYTAEERSGLASIIREEIRGAIDSWLARQKGNHDGIKAAAAFSAALEDLTSEIEFYCLEKIHLGELERAWELFLLENDGGRLAFAEDQRERAKKPRSGDGSRLKEITAKLVRLYPDMMPR